MRGVCVLSGYLCPAALRDFGILHHLVSCCSLISANGKTKANYVGDIRQELYTR